MTAYARRCNYYTIMVRSHAVTDALSLIIGPMWSGKTAVLLELATAQRPLYRKTVLVKHAMDVRHPSDIIASRSGLHCRADVVAATLDDITVHSDSLYVVDEAHFFGDSLSSFFARLCAARRTAASGTVLPTLLVAGLDLDYRREPFANTAHLASAAIASPDATPSTVTRLAARCSHIGCMAPAPYTQRIARPAGVGHRHPKGHHDAGARLLVGDAETYRPACAEHHTPSVVTTVEAWSTPSTNNA